MYLFVSSIKGVNKVETKQKTNDINEYNDLFDELSIEWYLITDLNEHLSEKTILLMSLYMEHTKDRNERLKAQYVQACFLMYVKFGLCPMKIEKLIKIMKCFFNFRCGFNDIFEIPNTKRELETYIKQENTRNLKKEIKQLEMLNQEAEEELKALEYKKQGVPSVNIEGVRLENVKRSESRTLKLIEQTDELKKSIAYRNKLIRHLQGIIKNKYML